MLAVIESPVSDPQSDPQSVSHEAIQLGFDGTLRIQGRDKEPCMTEHRNGKVVRCPAGPNKGPLNPGEEPMEGCGSANVIWDADEQLYDCLNCGMWFTAAEADLGSPSASKPTAT